MANLITDTELSKFFRNTPRTIRKWSQEFGMPKEGTNQYDFVKCVDWRIKFLEKELDEIKNGTQTEKQARIDFLKAKAERERIEVAKLNESIISISDLTTIIEKAFFSIRQKLLSIPKRLSMHLFTLKSVPEIENYLQVEINNILKELKNVSNKKDNN